MPTDAGPDAAPQRVAIDGRTAWTDAVHDALLALPGGNVRELTLVDVDFDAWPLGDPAVLDALTRWIRLPARRLHLLGLKFDGVQRVHPRFASWRRTWAHAIDVGVPPELEPGDMPAMLLVAQPPLVIELFDRERWRGRSSRDPREVRLVADRIGAISQRSEPGWAANTLGL